MSFFYEILNDGTPYRRKKLRVKRLILTIAAALFMLITLLYSFAIIPSGYTGVRTTFGQIDTVAVSNGFIVKIPYVQSIKRVNNKQQEVSYTDQIWGESSERTVVYAAGVTVTYRINPDYSAWIYANVSDYKQNALPQTLLSSAIKAAMVSLPSDEVTNRAKIEPIARQQLQTAIFVLRTSVACILIILSFAVFDKGERLFFASSGVQKLWTRGLRLLTARENRSITKRNSGLFIESKKLWKN